MTSNWVNKSKMKTGGVRNNVYRNNLDKNICTNVCRGTNIGRAHRFRYWSYRSPISIRGIAGPGP